jgi:La-related protein 7
MSSADAPGDLPAVAPPSARGAGGETGKGKGSVPEPEAPAADGDETSGKLPSEGSDANVAGDPPSSLRPLTDEQRAKITTQVEFYFSDANLPTDAFLLKKVKADKQKQGWVPIQVVCGFNRMKQLLKKHPPVPTVAAIVAERSKSLLVDESKTKIRRAEPLPEYDLEDIQARTVVAENLGFEPTVEGVVKKFTLDVFAAAEFGTKKEELPETYGDDGAHDDTNKPPLITDSARESVSVAPSMVRVRHPGMATPAEVCKATTGLDLVRVASSSTHALVEYASRELAELAVRTKNDDKDWRHGLRVRLLVKNVKAAAKKKKQQARALEKTHREEGERGEEEEEEEGTAKKTDGGDGGDGGAEPGAEAAENDDETSHFGKASKKKGKYKKGKRDYSQWASAAAFKENKTFLEGEDGGNAPENGDENAAASKNVSAASKADGDVSPFSSVSTAPRAPAMPDGTRGFAGYTAATGKPKRAFPPGVPTEPKKRETASAESVGEEGSGETAAE